MRRGPGDEAWPRFANMGQAACDSLLCMAESGRFDLSVRVLSVLAEEAGRMHTSASIAEALGESAVMVRRTFLLLHKAGLIEQKKGPSGGARLKVPAKEIGLGTVYKAAAGEWMIVREPALETLLKRTRADATKVMNEVTLSQILKKMKRARG